MTEAERYARKVVDGEVVACHWIKQAANRFLNDLQRDDIYFDEEEASRVVNFFELFLCHWEGKWAGTPIILEEWQKFIVQQIFAWRKKDGKKRVRRVYIQISRKNGKTAFAAGIALYHLFADSENAPQIYVGANNEDQAKICTNSCGRMIEASPRLRDLIRRGMVKLLSYNERVHTVTYRKNNGSITAMSKDAKTKDGFNPSLGIIDEYHEAKDDKLLNVIESGQGAREEPLLITITTAGFNKSGPCYSKLRKVSTEILDGIAQDDSHLAFIYEPDQEDDWKDEKCWIKSNPNYGVSVFPAYVQDRLTQAINEGGTKEVDFRTKNLNTWCDAAAVWIQDAVWILNTTLQITYNDLKGKVCYGGLDCAKSNDLNAFAMIFPDYFEINGKVITPIIPMFWMPEEKLKKPDHINYKRWVEERAVNGKPIIIKTDGNIADYNVIEHDILECIDPFDFMGYDYDHAYAGNIASNHAGLHGLNVSPLGQGFLNLTGPTTEFERMALGGLFEHFNNPVLRWMISNAIIKRHRTGLVMIDKEQSTNRVDGVSATINAIARWKREGTSSVMDYEFTKL